MSSEKYLLKEHIPIVLDYIKQNLGLSRDEVKEKIINFETIDLLNGYELYRSTFGIAIKKNYRCVMCDTTKTDS